MKPAAGPITTDFFEMRPLSKPEDQRDHIHGAIDIAAPISTPILAPESGTVIYWAAFRNAPDLVWATVPEIHQRPFPFCNYFYDTFGAIIVLRAVHGIRTHIIAHSWMNQLFNKCSTLNRVYEEPAINRFPMHAVYSGLHTVRIGDIIGYVGNAGYSTGAHVHWEIHHGEKWNPHSARINPEQWEA